MKKLLVLRGAPGSGKTTWIKDKRLIAYTLSVDNIRMLYQSPIQTIYATEAIGHKLDDLVMESLYSILEERMKCGEFTVIDAVNSKEKILLKYQELATRYRYKIYIIDFASVPESIVRNRNLNRLSRKRVPNNVMNLIFEELKREKIPKDIKVIKPNELNEIFEKTIDLSLYQKIHHIGDIHGCMNALQQGIRENGNFKEDECYIFLGDFTDKGPESGKVLDFVIKNAYKPNVILCEGNHEKWVWNWANHDDNYSDDFIKDTLPQIDGMNQKDLRKAYRQLKECCMYTFHEKRVLCAHGGIATIPDQIDFVSGHQLMHGVGFYSDIPCITKTFADTTAETDYQVFGHRNPGGMNMDSGNRVYLLENGVDVGGTLRWLTLDINGFHEHEYKNSLTK